MSEFNLIKCPQFLDNAITPPAKEIGTTLGNIFFAIFSPINYNVEKLKIKQSENLKKYQSDIESELSKIPENKLTEPKLSIVGPALEASKYYIEDSELRKMFAKLIASSMNSDNASKAHPAFVEIIKQLSPLDASNLDVIAKADGLPVAEYRAILKNKSSYITLLSNVFLSNPNYSDLNLIVASIDNLSRLGLIKINYSTMINNPDVYSIFETDPTYIGIIDDIKKYSSINKDYPYDSAKYMKGTVRLTSIGDYFCSICL
ncbi:DUF4393 domain-containing protein [Clostridium sp. VAP41]|uniref:DUF4393 domain-containing protein n=1 Tax=Clostridium sp. VAP41 TaxID=2949979 RepID=UPI00207A4297|nr:DUF4393 domain-containing protein [Clostridium sp. VAP41]